MNRPAHETSNGCDRRKVIAVVCTPNDAISSDDQFSRRTPKALLELRIVELPKVKRNATRGFVFDDEEKKRWVEIDLEVVSPEGDNIDDGASGDINCISVHIATKFFRTGVPPTVAYPAGCGQ